jgi:hypothetical protein
MADLDPEDAKLVVLARSALPRSRGATEGAAVRDEIGRTYAAAAVSVGDLVLSALQVAVAMAASSGVTRLEAAALVTRDGGQPRDADVRLLHFLGGEIPVFVDRA